MKVLQLGNKWIQENGPWEGTCNRCESKVTAEKHELTNIVPADYSKELMTVHHALEVCPVCGSQSLYLYPP